jgi:hypothetical protein
VIAWLAQEMRVEASDVFESAVAEAWPQFHSELLQKVQSLIALACLRTMEDDLDTAAASTTATEGIES